MAPVSSAPMEQRSIVSETTQNPSLFALGGIVVGSMVGSGIFSLPYWRSRAREGYAAV
jgi:hypothetical protein